MVETRAQIIPLDSDDHESDPTRGNFQMADSSMMPVFGGIQWSDWAVDDSEMNHPENFTIKWGNFHEFGVWRSESLVHCECVE